MFERNKTIKITKNVFKNNAIARFFVTFFTLPCITFFFDASYKEKEDEISFQLVFKEV